MSQTILGFIPAFSLLLFFVPVRGRMEQTLLPICALSENGLFLSENFSCDCSVFVLAWLSSIAVSWFP